MHFALPENVIEKDNHKRLQVCVSANGGHFEHTIKHDTIHTNIKINGPKLG